MQDFEKLGAFYLGKAFDMEKGATRDELLLYDSKDLTTHAMCVGMTGSGKTGLCLSLLEEAAIDGIPAIAIDPKGDLGNLFLTFPELAPSNFREWIDDSEAARKGMTPDQYAARVADMWRNGLASWGQAPDRIAKFRNSVDMSIYTPGSSAGLPLTVLRSFSAPSDAVLNDSDAFRERVSSAASGLLALLGIDADPVRSREHILISNILTRAWQDGRSLDIARLIGEIQTPPFEKVGIMDLETFFPVKDRVELAMSLNNLLASPSFASWMEGEPLDVKRLLYTAEGKPRLSIISIAHLSDPERMFFVTILLNEVLAWVRSQPGTSSLRALLYMDEVFGYFPPIGNPPSKQPMLTLLKQARAFGLGVVLATQNPVDLDYKGLSNTGTWFLGRLQAERDKMRVLEGLEGASAQAGSTFDKQKMEAALAGLSSRVFIMNNVHETEPIVFQTRWALSYLRGPLTRQHIQKLMEPKKSAAEAAKTRPGAPTAANAAAASRSRAKSPAAVVAEPTALAETGPPIVPPEVAVYYLRGDELILDEARLVYRPALLGTAKMHFSRSTYKVDTWQRRALLQPIDSEVADGAWEGATSVDEQTIDLAVDPSNAATFAELPGDLLRAKNYSGWAKQLKSNLYSTQRLMVFKCKELKKYSQAGESEGDFRIRLSQLAHEQRDLAVEKLRKKYASKFATIKDRIESAQAAVDRETAQARKAKFDTAISFGGTLLGALFGRKLASRTSVSRASTSMRSASRAAQQHSDIARAEKKLKDYKEKFEVLEEEFEDEVDELEAKFDVDNFEFEKLPVRPLKSDIEVGEVALVWTPWRVDSNGIAEPLFELQPVAS